MAFKSKKVEFFTVEVRQVNGDASLTKFEDLLDDERILNKEIDFKGKHLLLKILSREDEFITGIVETTRTDNIPAKKNRSGSTITKIGLGTDEGLAYGNIFLYDKKNKFLLFELNRNGCYLDHFQSLIQILHKDFSTGVHFRLKLDIIFTKSQYDKILNFEMFKSIEVDIARPDRLIDNMKKKHGPLFNIAKTATDLGSSKMTAKFEVEGRKKPSSGLMDVTIREVVSDIRDLFKTRSSDDFNKVEIKGYSGDVRKVKHIDMVAEKYSGYIKLEEPRENSDLLELARNKEIKRLYSASINDLKEIFLI